MLLPACIASTIQDKFIGDMPELSWWTWNPKLSTEQLYQQLAVVPIGAMHQGAVFLSRVVLVITGPAGTIVMAQHLQAQYVS